MVFANRFKLGDQRMKSVFLIVSIFFIVVELTVAQEVTVQFRVDMNQAIQYEMFQKDVSKVFWRSNYNDWSLADSMKDYNNNGVYEIEKTLPLAEIAYKFYVQNGTGFTDGWELGENRIKTITKSEIVHPELFREEYKNLGSSSHALLRLIPESQRIVYGEQDTLVIELNVDIDVIQDSISAMEFEIISSENAEIKAVLLNEEMQSRNMQLVANHINKYLVKVGFASTESISGNIPFMNIVLEKEEVNEDPVKVELHSILVDERNDIPVYSYDGAIYFQSALIGDVNLDGLISEADKQFVIHQVLSKGIPYWENHLPKMDANGDLTQNGDLSLLDAFVLDQWLRYQIELNNQLNLQPVSFQPNWKTEKNEEGQWKVVLSLNNSAPVKSAIFYTRASNLPIGLLPVSANELEWEVQSFFSPEINDNATPWNIGVISTATESSIKPLEIEFSVQDYSGMGMNPFMDAQLIIDSLRFNEDPIIAVGDTLNFDFLTVNVDEIPNSKKRMTLFPNYPNPFNPTTTLSFLLPESMWVELTIYSIEGRRVMQVVDEHLRSGMHEITINASHLPTGVYFYRLQSSTESAVKSMLLLK